jgi:hypothetical protein
VVAGARNHLQANRSLGFSFEIVIKDWSGVSTGDLRTFVPFSYAALSHGSRHRTWPSGRQALKASMRYCRPTVIAASQGACQESRPPAVEDW